MYFGVQGLLTKWMYGVSLWVMTYLLARFGNSAEQPLGVLLVGPVAGAACLLSLLLFARYPERELLEAVREGRKS
jgi:GPH family glycoside/pentoside/hexuronide:cation symporter